MSQFAFKFAENFSFKEEDFILSKANQLAFDFIKSWPNWGNNHFSRILYLYGPKYSGKTHLAHIWQHDTNALILNNDYIYDKIPTDFITNQEAYILEDLHLKMLNENKLLHFLNYMAEHKKYLLITSETSPKNLDVKLPDLRSRLLCFPSISIESPDEDLFKMILYKYFSDRQLKVTSDIVNFISSRIERSFAAAKKTVDLIDKNALDQRKNITIPFVSKLLDN